MKRRLIKKYEKISLTEKLCQQQRDLDEHERFLGDVMILLFKPEWEHHAIKHEVERCDYFEPIWDKIIELQKENEELKRSGTIFAEEKEKEDYAESE